MSKVIENPSIVSLGDLLDNVKRQFRIPMYQRDYAWQNDQIDDFIDDAFALADGDSEHFFGTIVLSDNSPGPPYDGKNKVRYIIDGQQRLTTALLVLASIRDLLEQLGEVDDASDLLTSTKLNRRDEPKLFANRTNQKFLTALLINKYPTQERVEELLESLDVEARQRSEKLANAYHRTRLALANRAGLSESAPLPGEAEGQGELLKGVADALLDRSFFVEINVNSWEDAFVVFEGLNNRGLDLSEQDLVKNTVLARAHAGRTDPGELTQLEVRWTRTTKRIAESKFTRFLRHYLLIHEPDVPLKRVVRVVNEHFDGRSAEEMLAEIERAAIGYERITRPSTEKNARLKDALINLSELEAVRSYPIVLAGLLRAPEQVSDLVALLANVEKLYFRRSAILQRDNKAIERDFQTIAHKLYHRDISFSGASNELAKLMPTDDDFVRAFKNRSHMRPKTAKYMLRRLQNHLDGSGVRVVGSDVTLEHIVPQSPSKWGLDPTQPTVDLMIHRLGNLTLLTKSDNASLGNEAFPDKKRQYEAESLALNRTVVSCEEWTIAEIEQRQRWMADLSTLIW